MKIHITNLYNFNKNDVFVKKQHRFAEAGRALGFLEMGIFSYQVGTDTPGELHKRMDGIIAALEPEDVVFMQLPTENGYDYERLLLSKIKAYQNTKVILVLHDTEIFSDAADKEMQSKYFSLYKSADAIIIPALNKARGLEESGFPKLLCCGDIEASGMEAVSGTSGYLSLCQSDFYLKKILMDAIETVYEYQKELLRFTSQAADDEIHIGFGLHDKTGNYSVWVGVAMQSIIEHTGAKVCFHILHDETLNEQNKTKLTQVAANGGNRLCFHLLSQKIFADMTELVGGYTIGTMFRIMLPELLPNLSRIIYLDADILVNRDIKELWDMNIHDYYLAAVPDRDVVRGAVRPVPVKLNEIPASRYFNAGVLYMNLERIREKGSMKDEILGYLERTKESKLPDQDALNAVYNSGTLLLDGAWNCFVRPLQDSGEKSLGNNIYHYVGTRCMLYSLAAVDQLYFETTGRTPWGAEECRKQMQKSYERVNDRMNQLEKLILQISAMNKKHIFYGRETFAMRNLYGYLTMQEGAYRVLAEPVEEINCILPCKDLSALLEEKESFVVFVLPEADGRTSIARLEQLGLENGKDFFVIPRLLPPAQGGYI